MTDLIKKYGKEKQWVNWRYEKVNDKLTKVPYFSKAHKAASNDPLTWKTYEEAETDLNNGSNKFDGLGIFFKEDLLLLGVDIDHCLEGTTIVHEKKDVIEQFIKKANTFSEISPSKTGLHLFFALKEPFTLTANKKAPFELYNRVRFLTVTNEPYEDKEIRTLTVKQMDEILLVTGYPWKKELSMTAPSKIMTMTDQEVVDRMFSSKKIGNKLKALYNGDTSEYENDKSKADYALCSSLAFWTGKNAAQIERIWLNSPLGQRVKTKDRKDYRDRTINKAIENCIQVYETPTMKLAKENPEIDFLCVFDKQGEKIIVQNTENICRVLRGHENFKGHFRFDAFKNIIEIKINEWRQFEDNDAVNIQTAISILFPPFTRVGKEMVFDAIVKVCKENTIDSAVDYLKNLVWDKKPRLGIWLKEVYGAVDEGDNVYHREVGSNWLKGLVKRLVEPGCKFDYVLVLEGEQGVKKSTSLAVLGSLWHTETAMSTDTKDFFMQFQGKAIIEFSEGETLSRTEVKRMKAIITMQSDRFRAPYERATRDFPRRCVFAMTTNQGEYLKDETGNRRWLPVRVLLPKANIEWLKENRDQLFAEAYYRVVELKETVYELPEDEALAQQSARRISDPYQDQIAEWYFNSLKKETRDDGISIHDVYKQVYCGGLSYGKEMTKWQEMNIANVLKDHLKLIKRQTLRNKVRIMRWYNPNVELPLAVNEIEDAFINF